MAVTTINPELQPNTAVLSKNLYHVRTLQPAGSKEYCAHSNDSDETVQQLIEALGQAPLEIMRRRIWNLAVMFPETFSVELQRESYQI